jgi:hypothetical protein
MSNPFTRDELIELWKSVVDPTYSQPLLAGGSTGIELIEQLAEGLARASEMVNRDAQAMFIMPYSGQTEEPASGAKKATVTLTVSRTGSAAGEVTLPFGLLIEQVVSDYGPDGPVEVRTGRRYAVPQTIGLVPGVMSIDVEMEAELPGYGYNLPLAGTISAFVQPGATLQNDGARLILGITSHRLVLAPRADALSSQNIGQYVLFMGGANGGQRRRIVSFVPPTNSSTAGSAFVAATGVIQGTLIGNFTPGETIEQSTTGATGTLISYGGGFMVYDRLALGGAFDTSAPIFGVQSGAVLIPTSIDQDPDLVADNAVVWRVLGWESDLGLTASNATSPEGGRSPMLDELGRDRGVNRSPGEIDNQYRVRVHKLPDVVSPNAIRRSANRVLAEYGSSACFREVGEIDALFPGFFYDVAPADVGFDPKYAYAYDLDFDVRPQDRFKLVMDYVEFRAFFMIGVPPASLGEFGFFYDVVGIFNFYDSAPYLTFMDGFPLTSAVVNRRVYDAVNKARAGGVSFDLYEERRGCF